MEVTSSKRCWRQAVISSAGDGMAGCFAPFEHLVHFPVAVGDDALQLVDGFATNQYLIDTPLSTGKPLNPSNVRRDIWQKVVKCAGVPQLDLYALRHTFATLGRAAGGAAFNVARMMGHSNSTLVDSVYAHSMQSGMASVVERVTARALGEKPELRVLEGGKTPDAREPLENSIEQPTNASATV